MLALETVSRGLRSLFDLFYIPPHLRREGEFVVHFSDTPRVFYRSMKRLNDLLRPRALILTGDLVDDVKVGIYPGMADLYLQGLKELRGVLSGDFPLFITPGNHDLPEAVREAFPRAAVDHYLAFDFEGLNFECCHYAAGLSAGPGTIGLFGHDGTPDRLCPRRLNGQLHINLIDRAGEVWSLDYPRYVEDSRQLKRSSFT